jgi:hypothetical protein
VFEHRRCEPRDLVFDAADRQAEKSTDGKLLQKLYEIELLLQIQTARDDTSLRESASDVRLSV